MRLRALPYSVLKAVSCTVDLNRSTTSGVKRANYLKRIIPLGGRYLSVALHFSLHCTSFRSVIPLLAQFGLDFFAVVKGSARVSSVLSCEKAQLPV